MTIKHVAEFSDPGVFAIYDEAPGGGDMNDIHALRNRPALDPDTWFANVHFHSDMDFLEVLSDTTITINHAAITAATITSGSTAENGSFDVDATPIDWELNTHSLGIIPYVLVAKDQDFLTPGYPVQSPVSTNGSMRFVCPYVDTNKVYLREYQYKGSVNLSAISVTYRIVVFKDPPAPSGDKLRDWNASTGILKLARNKFDSSKRYLQIVAGGTPFGLAVGRTMQARNGAVRIVAPDGTFYDPIPNTIKTAVTAGSGQFSNDTPYFFGNSMEYNGTFSAVNYVEVQAP